MTLVQFSLLAASGLVGGIANAIAGGGSFFTFAVLVASGISALDANATSAIALVPGSFAIGHAYRKEIAQQGRALIPVAILSIVGGAAGGALLIAIGDERFRPLVPWLLGTATLLFAVSGKISDLVKMMSGHHGLGPGVRNAVLGIVAIYGGFFGAGMGIMILAAVALTEAGEFDFHKANATKNVVATLSQTLAVLMFIAGGLVHWPEAGIICVTAIVGGYYGIYLTRRISVGLVRAIVVTAGAALTLVFFLR